MHAILRTMNELGPVLEKHGCSAEFEAVSIFLGSEAETSVPDEMIAVYEERFGRRYEWLIEFDEFNACIQISLGELSVKELDTFITEWKQFLLEIETFKIRLEQCDTCDHCPRDYDPFNDTDWCHSDHISDYTPNCPFYEQ